MVSLQSKYKTGKQNPDMPIAFVKQNRMLRLVVFAAAGLAAGLLFFDDTASTSTAAPGKQALKSQSAASETLDFEKFVRPALAENCMGCHNDRAASGGLNLGRFMDISSVTGQRDEWEMIARRVEAGEMPPPGAPKDAAQLNAMLAFLKKAFERADRNLKPDPGRVAARRLNRVEYANTIRDLLGVSYRADREFPRDDEGEGFDNIADLLSVSPLLAEKYMSAAAEIAAKAMGTETLPRPTEFGYMVNLDPKIRKHAESLIYYGQEAWLLDASTMEFRHHVDYSGEYRVRIDMAGSRGKTGAPVKLGLWMDGQLLESRQIETKTPTIEGFGMYPYWGMDTRLVAPQGDHVFRLGIIDDELVKKMKEEDAYNPRRNIFPYGVKFFGPYPAKMQSASRQRILTCDPKLGLACSQAIVRRLARRAFRRPVTGAEVAALMRFVKTAETPEQGIQNAIRAMLVSPHFLFRIERDPAPNQTMRQNMHRISDVELASRLSYFLWSSMPDDELLRVAIAGRLRAPGVLAAQIKRMIADPKSSALAENFAGQWLQLRNMNSIRPDAEKFPDWGAELREAMKTETRMFFESVLREDRPVTDFLNARYTFLNERLAKHYGIANVTGPDFRRVALTTDQRGGITSHGSVLAVSSYPTRTSVVLRGKYILENIFNTPPPPPPANVPVIDDNSVGATASLRSQMESHRANPSCAVCHNKLDPMGFALENYDAIGRWRTMDGKFPVDASGTVPHGKSFSTPAEFRAALVAKSPEFARALTEKLMIYALGRGLERFDKPTIDAMQPKLAASGYRFQTLIQEIVTSLPFQARRGDVLQTELGK
jgi:mono/diheme cytochrome c family protein